MKKIVYNVYHVYNVYYQKGEEGRNGQKENVRARCKILNHKFHQCLVHLIVARVGAKYFGTYT